MSSPLDYYESLYAAAFNVYRLEDIARFVTEKTFRNGQLLSFADFPFQERCLSDTTQTINFMKPAQVGCSEMMARYALAACNIIPCFTTIYVAPYSTDSEIFMKTRIDPVIEESPTLKAKLDRNIDNTQLKGFGSSMLFARGASGETKALSIPADLLIFDELDKADPDVVGQYSSRVRNSPWQLVRKLSTPTIAGYGIHEATLTSHRWHYVCKCNHCNEMFIPDYEEQVVIPGYDGEKKDINKRLLPTIRWKEAALHCPRCGAIPDLTSKHREWVCENPSENWDDERSYIINPFDAPAKHNAASITKELTRYNTYGEAQNQVLGKVSSDTQQQLTEEDIKTCKVTFPLDSSNLHCLGGDMGLICHLTISRLTAEGQLLIVHREKVLMQNFEIRRRELCLLYRVVISVLDGQPFTELVYKAQQFDKNVYGARYSEKDAPPFEVKKVEEDVEAGKLPITVVKINRTHGFDEIMSMFKNKSLMWAAKDDVSDQEFVDNCLDMKRVQIFDKYKELIYRWEKSKAGEDHWHHSTLYAYTACKLLPTMSRNVPFTGIPLVKAFKVKTYS